MADSRRAVEEEVVVLETAVLVAEGAVEAVVVAESEMRSEANGIQLHRLLHH
jgi:hypothetical protein